jgi:membrane protein implicated in regulation of membrane protease activity
MIGLIFLILIVLVSMRCTRPAHCFAVSGGAIVLAFIIGLIRDGHFIAQRGFDLNPMGLAVAGGLFVIYSLVSLTVCYLAKRRRDRRVSPDSRR